MLQSRNIFWESRNIFWQSRYIFFGKNKIFLIAAKTKVLIPAVLRSEWMFSCSCERCSDPAQADMGTHMSSFSCGCGGFYTARQTCRRCVTMFKTENNNTEGRHNASSDGLFKHLFMIMSLEILKCESIISKVYFIHVEGASRCSLWMLYSPF